MCLERASVALSAQVADSLPLAARCRRLPLEASNCGCDKLLMSAEQECARHTDMHCTFLQF